MTILAALPFYPLLSFILLIGLKNRLSWQLVSILSIGSVFLSAISAIYLTFALHQSEINAIQVNLWNWFAIALDDGSKAWVSMGFYFDQLTAVMTCVVAGIGCLIHLYAAAYMKKDEAFHRFMSYMNLFIVAMLILVLADNLVLLYLGWEGVGLCSFLLIGFWFHDGENVKAARKAFIVTRVGDASMALGLILLFYSVNTLTIVDINQATSANWLESPEIKYAIGLLLLGGAVGKSAQLPLHTWLPDAMAGPTPVSALIHAATMVTAGVYLIARLNGLYLALPDVMTAVACVGALTLLLAGVAALAQTDIKRVLAYSTMSQIGYMMLALGAGAFSAGVFHLMTHAFFKALLFLTAGSIIAAMHHQQDIFKMGGLAKKLPFESVCFGIGLYCLVALPGSSGFFSKESIIAELWQSNTAGPWFWWAAIVGALLTAIYSTRLFCLVCLGHTRSNTKVQIHKHGFMTVSLSLLLLLSIIGGVFTVDLSPIIATKSAEEVLPHWQHWLAIGTPFIGIAIALLCFKDYWQHKAEIETTTLAPSNSIWAGAAKRAFGFDQVYHCLFVSPVMWVSQINKKDIFDQLVMLNAWYTNMWREVLISGQNGSLRWYAAAFSIGIIVAIGSWLL